MPWPRFENAAESPAQADRHRQHGDRRRSVESWFSRNGVVDTNGTSASSAKKTA